MSASLDRLETYAGAYAERRQRAPSWLDRTAATVSAPFTRWRRRRGARPARRLALTHAAGLVVRDVSDWRLRELASSLRTPLQHEGFRAELVARAFALVREAAWRTVGQRHRDVQLIGGGVLLDGLVAEMQTGEGKTLTATLPACTAALAGIPVHIVTVNDYLARRDAQWMAPIYQALGLTVGAVVHGMDLDARRRAYACDVTYCTNKELGFDYLRDRLVLGDRAGRVELQLEQLGGENARASRLLLRGLHYAIVDEADSVLVDEARTPLVISGAIDGDTERRVYQHALSLADHLDAGDDFRIDAPRREVTLTARGQRRVEELARPLGGIWAGRLRREEFVRQALTARHLFRRDTHYLVEADGRLAIIDEFTGRLMPDRAWEAGLHQLIEVKEGCAPTSKHLTLARVSYQRFFRRYLRLAGMTATAREIAPELWAVYRLAVVRVPPHRPVRRQALPDRMLARMGDRWSAVVRRVADVHRTRRPVLIGTRSVAASEELSRLLTEAGLRHQLLNARQDAHEAELIAEAGQQDQITVATNMAGRGTDIRLGPGVADAGGLHVIATERHEARRIDRQLAGRGGRQGDPGSFEAIVSLDDELIVNHAPTCRAVAALFVRADGSVPMRLARLVVRRAQRAAERRHAQARRDLVRMDDQLDTTLAFSAPLE
jgi:preprotein translocase subunit SecA